jgi:NADPH:quinone reductase-like Zn-dependent oxidoreductase
VFFRHLQVLGATGSSKTVLFKLMRLLEEGKIHPVLDRVLPLREARQAHQLLEERKQFGKVVLIPE